MKSIALISLGLILATEASVCAQGSVYLSNLDQDSYSGEPISSDWQYGMLFRTGMNPQGYELNSVDLLMSAPTGSPAGFELSLNAYAGFPGAILDSLLGIDPLGAGLFSYSASQTILAPSTLYFILASGDIPVAQGAYRWNQSTTTDYTTSEGWFLSPGHYFSFNGTDWFLYRTTPMQLSIHATPIPEPSSGLLLLIGGIGFISRRLKKISKRL